MWREKAKDVGRVERRARTRQARSKTRRGGECWLASNWIPPIYHSRFGSFGHPPSLPSPLSPGSPASRTKIGDEPPSCPFIGRRFAGRGSGDRREPQIRFVERRAEFLVGRGGHSHRVQGVVRGSKSYWSWCTPWQMDELFSAASRVLREM